MMSLLVLAAFALQAQAPVESVTIREGECYAMVQNGNEVVSTRILNFHVIEATAGDGPLAVSLPAGTGAIACPRSDIVPAPNDWKVIAAGYPLMILERTPGAQGGRVAALEISDGQVRYRFVSGRMTEEEGQRIEARLDAFQPHFYVDAAPHRSP